MEQKQEFSEEQNQRLDEVELQLILITLEMIKKYPDDTELGAWVRKHFKDYLSGRE